jgi:hypothetical protein
VKKPIGVGSEKDKNNSTSKLTDHKRNIQICLFSTDIAVYDDKIINNKDAKSVETNEIDNKDKSENYDGDDDGTNNGDEVDDVVEQDQSQEERIENAVSSMQHLGNIKRVPFSIVVLTDIPSHDQD